VGSIVLPWSDILLWNIYNVRGFTQWLEVVLDVLGDCW